MNNISKTQRLVIISMFAAIIIILAATPVGYIQLGFIKATIIHVPVIIGAIMLGPRVGFSLGLLFGATSLISNTFAPLLLSFAFSPLISLPGKEGGSILALLVCFIPRVLVGIVPWYVYVFMKKILKNKYSGLSYAVAGLAGSVTNTLLVMHLIYFLFKDAYASVKEISIDLVYKGVLGIIFTNGVPEAIVACIITAAVCKALSLFNRQKI